MAALRQLALAAAVLAAALAALPLAAAHGYMAQPAARNYIHSTYYERTQQERQAIPESYWVSTSVKCWGAGCVEPRASSCRVAERAAVCMLLLLLLLE